MEYKRKVDKKRIPTCNIMGVNIAAINMEWLVDYLEKNISEIKGDYICVSNVHTTVTSFEDADYCAIQNGGLMAIPDGGPLSTVGQKRGHKNMERTTGPSLMGEIKPIGFHRESTALNDTDMKYLLLYLEETYGLTNEKKIDNAIGIVANENKYHPIRDYLNTLVWDGTERIRFCLRHFLGADADDYTYEALKLFLLGAISRAFQPGCKFEIMLCLVGGQGAGKSTFFRLLAVRDEWFSDDLRKLDDDNVYRKLQGHWIIEMSEMMATANAKSIEEIKSFLSRQKEVYKIPYETHPADRPRQCVFGGTSNALDFLPLDRSGNRRFIPVMVYPEQAEVHILEDEAASRAYIEQMWAEAMEIYRSGRFKLAFSPAMQRYLKEHQRDFMPEDTKAGMIQAYLDKYTGSMVCSKQLYKEALNHAFDEPKQWEIREINEIMNQCIDRWRYFPNPRMFSEYGRQKGWERENPATDLCNPSEKAMDGFVEVTEQMELPF